MLKRIVAALCVILTSACTYTPPQVERVYAPGTIGYLHNACLNAISQPEPLNFYNSWCVQFLHGLYRGAYAGDIRVKKDGEPTVEYTPICLEKVEEEKRKLHSTEGLCTLGFATDKYKRTIKSDLDAHLLAVKVVLTWIQWLKNNEPDSLDLPLIPHVNKALRSESFCNYLTKEDLNKNSMQIHPALIKIAQDDDYRFRDDEKPLRCTDFSTLQKIDKSFIETSCGAYEMATIAGVLATDRSRAVNPEEFCASEIEKMYKHEITAKEICLTDKTPLEEFVKPENNRNFCK